MVCSEMDFLVGWLAQKDVNWFHYWILLLPLWVNPFEDEIHPKWTKTHLYRVIMVKTLISRKQQPFLCISVYTGFRVDAEYVTDCPSNYGGA